MSIWEKLNYIKTEVLLKLLYGIKRAFHSLKKCKQRQSNTNCIVLDCLPLKSYQNAMENSKSRFLSSS